MAFVYSSDSALNQALGNVGSGLGQIVRHRAQQANFNRIGEKIKGKEWTPTLLQEVLSEPGGVQYLQMVAPVIAPLLKEQARSQGASQWLQQNFNLAPNPNTPQPSPQPAAPMSPIQEAAAMQQNETAPLKATPKEEAQSISTNVPSISGVPNDPSQVNSNRVGPQEQTIYQQGGQQAMGLEPPQETTNANIPVSKDVNPFDITKLSDTDITKLAGSPYKEHQNMAAVEIQRRGNASKQMGTRETALLKLNEPKLAEVNEKIDNFTQSGLGFDRMEQILTQEGNKFPSSFTAAFFDLEGENGLSKLARSKLDPAVQEFSKLIVNQLKDAKGTFGARLTNLDVNTYLRGLPSLMNTPEGRIRILNQLKTLNKINQVYNEGILTEFEKAGGSDKIAYSDAVARAKKATAKETAQLRDQFVNPTKNKFSSLPDASLYKGKRIRDESTGEIFISDGVNWERGK